MCVCDRENKCAMCLAELVCVYQKLAKKNVGRKVDNTMGAAMPNHLRMWQHHITVVVHVALGNIGAAAAKTLPPLPPMLSLRVKDPLAASIYTLKLLIQAKTGLPTLNQCISTGKAVAGDLQNNMMLALAGVVDMSIVVLPPVNPVRGGMADFGHLAEIQAGMSGVAPQKLPSASNGGGGGGGGDDDGEDGFGFGGTDAPAELDLATLRAEYEEKLAAKDTEIALKDEKITLKDAEITLKDAKIAEQAERIAALVRSNESPSKQVYKVLPCWRRVCTNSGKIQPLVQLETKEAKKKEAEKKEAEKKEAKKEAKKKKAEKKEAKKKEARKKKGGKKKKAGKETTNPEEAGDDDDAAASAVVHPSRTQIICHYLAQACLLALNKRTFIILPLIKASVNKRA